MNRGTRPEAAANRVQPPIVEPVTTDQIPTHFTAIEEETEFNAASPTFTPTGRYRLVWNDGTRTAWMPEDMAVELFEGTSTPDVDPQDFEGWVYEWATLAHGEVYEVFRTRDEAAACAEWLVSDGRALTASVQRYSEDDDYLPDDHDPS